MAHLFMPREHGATAMLLMPFCAAAILARTWRWEEVAALLAVLCAFMAKEPLAVLARRRWVWKQEHPEARLAMRCLAAELALMTLCGVPLLAAGPRTAYVALFGAAVIFSMLAVWVNVQNRQRSTAFQVASAVVLTSTALPAALAATGGIPGWCWWLWGLMAAQSAAGIFTVHARLDAKVAAKKQGRVDPVGVGGSRRTAFFFCFLLLVSAVPMVLTGRYWLAAALAWAAFGYTAELARQRDPRSLQMPLTRLGVQTLALSLVYGGLVVRGLW